MPIKDPSIYPSDWPAISKAARLRAGNQCEWCGIPNLSIIHRGVVDKFQWITDETWQALPTTEKLLWNGNESKIVLTVAHYDHDTTNNDSSNLKCLCNRCHLNHDAQHHAKNAKVTRTRKKIQKIIATGQMSLIGDES